MSNYKTLTPENMSKKAVYQTLTQTVIPRPIAFVTTKTKEEIVNGAPFSYFNVLSAKPALLSVTVGKKDGVDKDTARNIKLTNEFVVHLTTEANIEAINLTAKNLSSDESEIALASLSLVSSDSVSTPSIKESPVRFECKLYQIIPFDNDGEVTSEMFIGKIEKIHVDETMFEGEKISAAKLKPIARLGGNEYATLGNIFTLDRPK